MATSQVVVVRFVILEEHIPQLVALIWYCMGHKVSVVTGLQVNVSRAIEPVLVTLTVIFSLTGGGWRSKKKFNVIINHMYGHHLIITLYQ